MHTDVQNKLIYTLKHISKSILLRNDSHNILLPHHSNMLLLLGETQIMNWPLVDTELTIAMISRIRGAKGLLIKTYFHF